MRGMVTVGVVLRVSVVAGVVMAMAVPGAIGMYMFKGVVVLWVVAVINALAIDLDFPRSATASGTHGFLLLQSVEDRA